MWAVCANAQEYPLLKGRVLGADGEAVIGAVVSCIELPDSTAIAHCVTTADGEFQIVGVNTTNEMYLLEVSHLGFEKSYVKPISNDIVITLNESVIALDYVVITSRAPILTQKPGKFVYTPRLQEVESMDSYEMLRYTPLIALDNNTISILGKGSSVIYINGRKPIMDNASLMEMLRSTPASQIKAIEIIISPNSSHKASINGGIVNIVMKKNPNQGFMGSTSVSGTHKGTRVSPRATLNLGYSKKQFNASANFSYYCYNSLHKTNSTYNYQETFTDLYSSTTQQTNGHFLNGNINMTYDFTKKCMVGASLHIGGSVIDNVSKTKSISYCNGINNKFSTSTNDISNPFKRPEFGIAAYYNLKTNDNGSNLDLSINYSSQINVSLGNMEYAKGLDENHIIPYSLFQQNSTTDSYGYELKGCYSHIFDDNNNLDAGYEFNASHLSNDFIRNDFNGNEFSKNESQSNLFIYDEKINALYISYDKKWGRVLSTTIGVRAENTIIKGAQITSKEEFHRNYWNFFPKLSVLADLANGNHNIALDISRSIIRPFYNDLNSFKIWTAENTYTMGNINIKPMICYDVDLCYSFLNDYIIGTSYNYESDAFSEYSYVAEENTTISSVANFGHNQALSIYFNIDKVLANGIWRMSFSASADYEITHGNIEGQEIGYKKWMGNVCTRNVFKISPKRSIKATMSYNYYTPSQGVLKIGRHKHLLNLSISKEFKFGGIISVDALNLLNYKPSSYYNTKIYSYINIPQTNNISIEVKYSQKFGHSRVRGAQNRSGTNHLGRFKNIY